MKDDRQIEEMLREHWHPEPPPGMRERVLHHAAAIPVEAVPAARRACRWQLAFAGAGLSLALAAGISDHFRHERLNTLAGITEPMPAIATESLPKLKQDRDRLLAWLAAPASAGALGEEDLR